MKGDVPAFLVTCYERVRRRCVVREVRGKQYPVQKWQLDRWEQEQVERRRQEVRRITKSGARLAFRKGFRTSPA